MVCSSEEKARYCSTILLWGHRILHLLIVFIAMNPLVWHHMQLDMPHSLCVVSMTIDSKGTLAARCAHVLPVLS